MLKQLTQKLSNTKGKRQNSSLYSGITIKHFLSMLEQDEDDKILIYVNKEKYDPVSHDYMLINNYTIKQELIKKEFKEKIILQLSDVDDLLRIAPDTKEFKSTYGYVIKITIKIKTK